MKPFPSSTLITPTYNWPEALELLLLSVRNQTVLPSEVIVADDGSRPETTLLIKQFQPDFPVPLIHIFHEDNGNRKPAIMNKALAKAKGDYIIEIDGDIIMHPNFIEDHLTFAHPGLYLFGSRVTINKEKLPKLFASKQIEFNFFSSDISKRPRAIRMPWFMLFEKPVDKKSSKLRGCNMSFWKKDVIAVNGFNEGLTGWGQDDSELIQRLHNIGVQGRRLKHCGIAFHIYHKEQSKSHVAHNHAIENETTLKNIKFIEKGVNQYL